MRFATLVLLVSVLSMAGVPGALANEQVEGRYIVPSHGVTACPTGITNTDPVCVGGVIARAPTGNLYTSGSAKVIDDVWGEQVAYTMCVGDDDNLQGCTPGAFVCGPGSLATDSGAAPHSTISVFILSFYMPENGFEPCIGTAGTVTITFA